MTSSILRLDTLDDRREVWSLLHRLPPRRRALYLFRCCRVASGDASAGSAVEPGPDIWREVADAERCDRGDDRLTNNVYALLVAVANQYDGLDWGKMALELERYVKTGDLPPLPRPPRSPTPRSRGGPSTAASQRRPRPYFSPPRTR